MKNYIVPYLYLAFIGITQVQCTKKEIKTLTQTTNGKPLSRYRGKTDKQMLRDEYVDEYAVQKLEYNRKDYNDYNYQENKHFLAKTKKANNTANTLLEAGDLFTVTHLFPIAKSLMNQVANPGKGKGIVSSAKRIEALADKLFQSFFLTDKRIVNLKESDLRRLDSLYVLANVDEQEAASAVQRTNAQRSKKDDSNHNNARARHLTTLACHWRYVCQDPDNMDTCILKTDCNTRRTTAPNRRRHLRKNLAANRSQHGKSSDASLIDEKVEMIIASGNVPSAQRNSNDKIERIESVGEYLNNVLKG